MDGLSPSGGSFGGWVAPDLSNPQSPSKPRMQRPYQVRARARARGWLAELSWASGTVTEVARRPTAHARVRNHASPRPTGDRAFGPQSDRARISHGVRAFENSAALRERAALAIQLAMRTDHVRNRPLERTTPRSARARAYCAPSHTWSEVPRSCLTLPAVCVTSSSCCAVRRTGCNGHPAARSDRPAGPCPHHPGASPRRRRWRRGIEQGDVRIVVARRAVVTRAFENSRSPNLSRTRETEEGRSIDQPSFRQH